MLRGSYARVPQLESVGPAVRDPSAPTKPWHSQIHFSFFKGNGPQVCFWGWDGAMQSRTWIAKGEGGADNGTWLCPADLDSHTRKDVQEGGWPRQMKFKETATFGLQGQREGAWSARALCCMCRIWAVPSVIWSGQADCRQSLGSGRRHQEENLWIDL